MLKCFKRLYLPKHLIHFVHNWCVDIYGSKISFSITPAQAFDPKVKGHRLPNFTPGRVAQSVGHLTRKSRVLGSIPGLATYFPFSFRFFKKGSCQSLAKVCARSTG